MPLPLLWQWIPLCGYGELLLAIRHGGGDATGFDGGYIELRDAERIRRAGAPG